MDFPVNVPHEYVVILIIISIVCAYCLKQINSKHLLFRGAASRKLRQLSKLSNPQERLFLMRGTNPFVFEEMVLTALKKQGYEIMRNKRYTGDGGIDGQVVINGQHYLIQSKRYRSHINPAHVQDFIQVCKRRQAKGLFVHTGKTGPKSRDMASGSGVEIISGERLLKMLLG